MNLTYDPDPSGRYKTGYWYADSKDLGVDGDGPDPAAALAALIHAAEKLAREECIGI